MDIARKTDNNILEESCSTQEVQQKQVEQIASPSSGATVNSPTQQQQQQQQQHLKTKRKHRRGKPKSKNANKPYKKSNWKFQVPRLNYNGGGSGGGGAGINHRNGARAKLVRSRSLVPYNTNKFLMEEHLADVPSALLTPSGRTRDSSFSVDSEDNYFFSLPEDEEEFLTKEFANVYEKARVERLDNLTKQQLIEECLSIEDRYSSDLTQRQQQLNVQRISAEFMSKIRVLEEKIRELSRENYNLRCQLMRSAALAAAAAASPPSAAAPIGAAYEPTEPTPMDSSSEDSESDSSSSSSSSSLFNNDGGADGHRGIAREPRRHRSCSSRSSLSEYNGYIENNYVENDDNDILNIWKIEDHQQQPDYERQQLLEAHMVDDNDDHDDANQNTDDNKVLNRFPNESSSADGAAQSADEPKLSPTHKSPSTNEPDDSTAAASVTVPSMSN